jgi:hypothetical protein
VFQLKSQLEKSNDRKMVTDPYVSNTTADGGNETREQELRELCDMVRNYEDQVRELQT